MLQNLLKHKRQIAICAVLVVMLALVRSFEETLFYDPLLRFFKGEYQTGALPKVDPWQLFVGLLFRYALNTILSLAIIHVLFRDRGLTKFATVLYITFFIVLTAIFFIILSFIDNPNTLYLFYIRRFLIQPILLLLFIPAFFYQRNYMKPTG